MPVFEYQVNLKDGTSAAAKAAGQNVRGLAQEVQGLQGQMNSAGGSSMGLQEELAEVTGGLSLVVEAVGGAVVALGGLVVAGAAMAIEANEMKAKLTSVFDALGEGQISGKDTVAMLDELGDSIGQTRKQLAPLAQSFMTMGITGKDQLQSLTKAAASAEAITAGGAQAFTKLFETANAAANAGQKFTIPFKKLDAQLKASGLNVGDLAKQMGMTEQALTKGLKAGTVDAKKFSQALTDAATSKGAGPLARAGASLSSVWAKFQEDITKFFEDIDVGPFLDQVKDLFGIFSQGKPSGNALKAGIGGFFKEVFAWATKVVPVVKHFLLDMIIFGLKAYIAVKPLVKSIKEFFQSATGALILSKIVTGLKTALAAVAIVIGVVVVAVAGFMAASVAAGVAVWTLIGSIIEVGAKITETFVGWVSGASEAAGNFVKGLIDGITNGAAGVVKAVAGLAGKAKDGFKNALGIASPSKVMMQLGGHAAAGVAEGMSAGAPDVHAASSGLASSAAAGMSGPMTSGGGGGGGGGGGNTYNVNVSITGASGSAMEITESMISLVFERMALANGL